jgi:hypothetical protein
MPICQKCGKDKKGRNGKKSALVLFALAIPITWFLGIELGIFMVGLAAYLLIAHNPSKFICEDCTVKSCPECSQKLETRNLCKKCGVATCSYCGHHQTHKTSVSWPLAILGVVLLPIVIGALMGGLMIAPWVLVVFILFYLYYSSPKCIECNERIMTTYF